MVVITEDKTVCKFSNRALSKDHLSKTSFLNESPYSYSIYQRSLILFKEAFEC